MEIFSAPGKPLARLREVNPAARIMAASRKIPVQRGPRSKITRMDPTATICTMPRTRAIAVSRSRWTSRFRASSTTANATSAATAACASPSCSWLLKMALSKEHLGGCSDLHHASTLQKHHTPGHARSLGNVMRDHHTCQPALSHNFPDQRLDAAFRLIIQRGRGLIEQQDFGRVGQGARQGNPLRFSAGKIRYVARSKIRKPYLEQQSVHFAIRQDFTALARTKAHIVRNCSRKEKRPLHDHSDLAAQISGRNLPVIHAFERDSAAGGLVETVQQSKK